MIRDFGKPKKKFEKPHIWWVAMKPPVVCIGIRSGSTAIG